MREIKFRVWDYYNQGRMIYLPSIYCRMYVYQGLPIMQSTGLLDKNGKEIYEGDIIQTLLTIGVVEFIRGKFVITTQNVFQDLFDLQFNREVIGNIYENPELIK